MTSLDPSRKILTRSEMLGRFGRPRTGSLVFTNGCFDLLHPGHVHYLAEARALGDALVVAVNSDASVHRLGKRVQSPLVPESDRALVLAGLESVDAVCVFDEDTPRDIITELLPDVLVKGSDYEMSEVVGRDEVEASGGRVALIPFVEGYSTTSLIDRIQGLIS